VNRFDSSWAQFGHSFLGKLNEAEQMHTRTSRTPDAYLPMILPFDGKNISFQSRNGFFTVLSKNGESSSLN
jgi:hypothetical protein